MRNYLEVTRQMLEDYGITQITECGNIFMGDKGVRQHIMRKKGKYKEQAEYVVITLSDKSEKIYNPKYGKGWYHYKSISLTVQRAVYAWFKGAVPAGMDVDHKDNNTLNNHIDNLQLLTREQNNQKKLYSRNQHTYNMTDEEIAAKRATQRSVYDRQLHKYVTAQWCKDAKLAKAKEKQAKKDRYKKWHALIAESKKIREERDQAANIKDWTQYNVLDAALTKIKAKILLARMEADE